MTEPRNSGMYDLSNLDDFVQHVGSIFDNYGDEDLIGNPDNPQCQELSDRLQSINERLADPETPAYLKKVLLSAMLRLAQQLRHPPCGGIILPPPQ